jgi:ABC-type amino acid transport substrate-binding protein
MNYAILTTSDAGVTSPADLAGKRVAVDAGRPAEYYLLDRGLERGLYKRQEAVAEAVGDTKQRPGSSHIPSRVGSRRKPDHFVIPLREPSLDYSLGAATRAEDASLTTAVDRAVEELIADGTIKTILIRYRAVPD